jgi:DNA-binding MarR family transcriptional regulator
MLMASLPCEDGLDSCKSIRRRPFFAPRPKLQGILIHTLTLSGLSVTPKKLQSVIFLVDFSVSFDTLKSGLLRIRDIIPGAAMDAWHEIAMSLRGAYMAMHRQADGEFARYGITADQFVILAVLSDGAALAQAEVCRRTHSDPNTISAMLALLETRGLVGRMKHPKDGRSRSVVLKPKGKRIFAKVWANREATRRRMEALFAGAEVETLVQLLKRIKQELASPQRRRKRRTAVTTDGIADSPPLDSRESRS